ncbi:MAG: nucleotidyltransferase domain-containing protein [Dehalococcoidales bacterium]|nr:nucleotidyltransferase domain-containing protein [Dehalococcoidales bacterium]
MPARIAVDHDAIRRFCEQHHVRTLALFGSALRDDFGPASDTDILVEFADEAHVSLFEFTRMRDELILLFGRRVDLVEKRSLRNPFRRREILGTTETLYAA